MPSCGWTFKLDQYPYLFLFSVTLGRVGIHSTYYIGRQTDRERQTDGQRQTDRQTDKHAGRQTGCRRGDDHTNKIINKTTFNAAEDN